MSFLLFSHFAFSGNPFGMLEYGCVFSPSLRRFGWKLYNHLNAIELKVFPLVQYWNIGVSLLTIAMITINRFAMT